MQTLCDELRDRDRSLFWRNAHTGTSPPTAKLNKYSGTEYYLPLALTPDDMDHVYDYIRGTECLIREFQFAWLDRFPIPIFAEIWSQAFTELFGLFIDGSFHIIHLESSLLETSDFLQNPT